MNRVKRYAYNCVIAHLETEIDRINLAIGSNKFKIKDLAEEQTRLKRERAELHKLIRIVENDRDKGVGNA
jgi:hypothetical protein